MKARIADAPSAPVILRLVAARTGPRRWQDEAACQYTDPDAFFPEKGEANKQAKAVCAGCPVRAECLAYALEHSATVGRFGVWGGLSERERRRLLRTVQRHRRAAVAS
jgi:WhiB family redox-sensing transcriptional regulator